MKRFVFLNENDKTKFNKVKCSVGNDETNEITLLQWLCERKTSCSAERQWRNERNVLVSDKVNFFVPDWIKWLQTSTNRRASVNLYSEWEKLVNQVNGDKEME